MLVGRRRRGAGDASEEGGYEKWIEWLNWPRKAIYMAGKRFSSK